MTVSLTIGFLLLLSFGCAARRDWIEETLVTVDVTGVWRGRVSRAGGVGDQGAIELTLQQSGSRVTGKIGLSSLSASRATSVDKDRLPPQRSGTARRKDGKPLPPPTSGRDLINKMQAVA